MTKRRTRNWSLDHPEGGFDYIVVGAGLAGISCAAALSKMGKRVLVLEQHYVPGGFAQTFRRKAWVWDVGIHLSGQVGPGHEYGRTLDYLTEGRLGWGALGEPYDRYYWPDGFRFDYYSDLERYRDELLEAFPEERQAIDKWHVLVREVGETIVPYFMSRGVPRLAARFVQGSARRFFGTRSQQVLDELTSNERLKAVLCGQWFYIGSPPSESAIGNQAFVPYHFSAGAQYPVGGANALVDELLETVTRAGGWTRIRADVEQILVSKGRAIGVRVAGQRGGPSEDILARRVVSAIGVRSTVTRLLPPRYRSRPWAERIAALKPSCAHVCIFLGFDGDIERAGATRANIGLFDTWDYEARWQVDKDAGVGRAPYLFCCFNSLKDDAYDAEPYHTGEVMAPIPWESVTSWRGTSWRRRPEDYVEFKRQIQDVLLSQYFEALPELRSHLRYVEVSTPLSTDHYCRPFHGSIYGLEATPERYACEDLRARSRIRDLYYTGVDITSLGIVGSTMSGLLTAVAAEPLAGLKLAREIPLLSSITRARRRLDSHAMLKWA
ncbi:MAG TPA: NAD(P)/FAD-dependent oxidoreductase [Thermoanaerobaculia bacterium]|nr:NAD(P)/FAD-dependent oxidoreductase [Thermoanaerobaculia bacterium]